AIEQAKGVISELGQVGTDVAFAWLRSFARNHGRKLTDVATAVVDRTLGDPERVELLHQRDGIGDAGS
ncbi:MAG: ANTAR domain-containing protein, partial [Acidimicrobiales bacterium]